MTLLRATLRIASELPKGDPIRRRLLHAIRGRTAGQLDQVSSVALVHFGESCAGIARAVEEDLANLVGGGVMHLKDKDPEQAEELFRLVDPRSVALFKKAHLDRYHKDIANAIRVYEEWRAFQASR